MSNVLDVRREIWIFLTQAVKKGSREAAGVNETDFFWQGSLIEFI